MHEDRALAAGRGSDLGLRIYSEACALPDHPDYSPREEAHG